MISSIHAKMVSWKGNTKPQLALWILCCAVFLLGCAGMTPGSQNALDGKSGAGSHDQNSSLGKNIVRLVATPPQTPWIDTASLSEDGESIRFVTSDASLWSWSLKDASIKKEGSVGDPSERFELRPSGDLIVAVQGEAPRIIGADDQKEIMRFAKWKDASLITWSDSGAHFILSQNDGSLALWDVENQLKSASAGEHLEDYLNRQAPKHVIKMDGQPTSVTVSNQGFFLVALNSNGKKGNLYIWNPKQAQDLKFLGRTNDDLSSLRISSDGQRFAAVGATTQKLWVGSTKKQGFARWSRKLKARDASWTQDGLLLIHGLDGVTKAHAPDTGEERWSNNAGLQECWTSKKHLLCSDGKALILVDSKTGASKLSAAAWGSEHLIFSPDGHYVGNASPQKWLGAPLEGADWSKLRGLP